MSGKTDSAWLSIVLSARYEAAAIRVMSVRTITMVTIVTLLGLYARNNAALPFSTWI